MASSIGFVCAFAVSDNQLSSVYCLKVPDDGAVVDSTALTGHGGGCVTSLAAAVLEPGQRLWCLKLKHYNLDRP